MLLTVAGYLSFCAFILAPVCFCALCLKCRPEKAFLPLLLFNSMILYFLACFHLAGSGFPLLYALNTALYIPSAVKFFRLSPQERASRLFTPGFFLLLLFMTVLFLFLNGTSFAAWDSISHWGKVVKLFMTDGKLGCEYPRHILSHASYPPGSCMVSVLVHYCFFGQPFSEGLVIFSHELLSLGAFVMVYAALKWKNQLQMILLTFPVLFLSAMAKVYAYDYCYTDLMLALTMAVAFYHSVNIDRCTGTEIFFLALLLGALPMLRNAGWQYCISLYVLLAVTGFIHRKKLFYRTGSPRCSAGRIMLFACCFLLPLLLKYSWNYQMELYNTTRIFTGKSIDLSELARIFRNSSAPGWKLLAAYWKNIWHIMFIQLLFWAAAVIFARKKKDAALSRTVNYTIIFFAVSLCMFHLSMFIFYLFEFAANFPSQTRYLLNFTLIPDFVLLLALGEYASGKKIFAFQLPDGTGTRIFILAITTVIFTVTLFDIRTQTRRTGAYTYRRWRNDCAKVQKFDHLLRKKGTKFALITNQGNGFLNFAMSYDYPYNFSTLEYHDPVLPGKSGAAQRQWATPVTPEKLMQHWKGYDYIFIDRTDARFMNDFRTVFAGNTPAGTEAIRSRLFRVGKDGLLYPAE